MSILDNFCDYLDDNYDLKLEGRRVSVDGKSYTLTTFKDSDVLLDAIKKEPKFIDLIKKESEVFELLRDNLKTRSDDSNKLVINTGGMEDLNLDQLQKYVVCYDYNENSYILVDPENRRVVFPRADILLNKLNRKDQDTFRQNHITVNVIYDPFMKGKLERSNENILSVEMEEVTSYIPPKFLDLVGEASDEMPNLWVEFFEHLFPCEIDRDYVYDWVHYLLTNRNQTFLVLSGPQGTGKSSFAQLLMELVGRHNFHSGKNDFTSARFNSYLDQKQLILLDEFSFKSGKEKDELKRIINDEISTEAKGHDQKMTKNLCSFLILNNYASAMSIDPWDRRFSVPSIATEDITNIKGSRWVTSLKKSFSDKDMMASLYKFFKVRKPIHEIYRPFKGDYFFKVVRKGATKRYAFIIQYFSDTDKDRVSYSYLKEEYLDSCDNYNKKFGFPTVDEVSDFLETYRHRGVPLTTNTIEDGEGDADYTTNKISDGEAAP